VTTCRSADKCLYAPSGRHPDWRLAEVASPVGAKGGVWITHRSAAETIAALNAMGL
jgi:hypothetical protein